MCAINGCTGKDETLVERMNTVTSHRGPDGTGLWSDEEITLGHNRLAIIDLSEDAAQPMHGQGVVISFNGEIYNFKELRTELSEYTFKSNSDTEVILAAYKKWGEASFAKLSGIFAFALWDSQAKKLLLVRDRSGIKPLYWAQYQGKLLFSSEIKALLESGISRALDSNAFNMYLRVLYVPGPHTMFKEIQKLPPGVVLTWQGGAITQKSFVPKGREETTSSIEEVCSTIEKAVERQLISDRPIGIYLSGGIDSSVVLDCAIRVRKNIDTYSVGFELKEGEEPEKFNADFDLARQTAHHYGTKHHEVVMKSGDARKLLEEAVWHLDEPIANPTVLPMLALARETKKTAAVVLGGDGGDELFGGYERYRLSLLSSYYQLLPVVLRKLADSIAKLKKLNTLPGIERFALFMFQKDPVLRVVSGQYQNSAAYDHFGKLFEPLSKDFESQFMDVDRRTWLIDESLVRSDKMGMAAGLEARVPLLDDEVLALSKRILRKNKVTLKNTKVILKEAFRGRIPEYLFHQPKRGWFSPAAKWLRRPEFVELAQEVLSPTYYQETSKLFNWEEIAKMLDRHESKQEYNLNMLWALLTFQLWAKRFSVTVE